MSKAGELARQAARRQVRRRAVPLVLGVVIVPLTRMLLFGGPLLVPLLLVPAFALGFVAGGRAGAGPVGDAFAFFVGLTAYFTVVAIGRDFGVTSRTSIAGFVTITVVGCSLAYAWGTSIRRSRRQRT